MLAGSFAVSLDPFNERARIRIKYRMKGKELEIDYLWDAETGKDMSFDINLVLIFIICS